MSLFQGSRCWGEEGTEGLVVSVGAITKIYLPFAAARARPDAAFIAIL